MIGKVLDASAAAAVVTGYHEADARVTIAYDDARILYVPTLAVDEVGALRPDLLPALADLGLHPSVITRRLTDSVEPVAAAVEQLLDATGTCDVLAGHVIHTATTRGWPVLTADPVRLRRLAPGIDVVLI